MLFSGLFVVETVSNVAGRINRYKFKRFNKGCY